MSKTKRDKNIQAAYRKELDLKTKSIPNKKHKKPKYKNSYEM
jgi:hypothetical protein